MYHNGGCHKNLPMYTGFDVNLPDEEFRDTDPPSMGSVCAYLRARPARRDSAPMSFFPCSLGWGEARKKAGPHGGFLGRRYDPFCTECTAFVDHPPDDIWSPQVVRGQPHLADTRLPEGSRSIACKTAGGWSISLTSRSSVGRDRRTWGIIPRHQRLAYEMLTSPPVREAFDLSREDPRRARPLRAHPVRFGDAPGPAACRARRAVRQRQLGQLLQAV